MNQNEQPQSITPETKVGALLTQFPALEPVLIQLAPAFEKLRNPVLRKTVAKIATLRQVAQIGKIPLATLINTLRTTVGQTAFSGNETGLQSPTPAAPPAWFNPGKVVHSLDVRLSIACGEQPVTEVLRLLNTLPSGQMLELITPFQPAPLIEIAQTKGYQVWCQEIGTEIHKTYFHSNLI